MVSARQPPKLWPFLVAFGVAVAAVLVAIVVSVSASGVDEPDPGPLESLTILAVVPAGDGVVHAVTEEGGCRRPSFADVRVRADVLELRVIGRDPGGACTAEVKVRCSEVRLPPEAAGKRLVGVPMATGDGRASGETLARDCSPLKVRR